MSDTESTLGTIKDISKKNINLNTVLATIPILSSIFYALSRFVQYWLEISYLSFWNIPKEFIHENDKSFIYNFVTIIAIVTIVLLIAYVIYKIYKKIEFTSECKVCIGFKKALLIFIVFSSFCIGIGAILCLYLISKADIGTFRIAIQIIFYDCNIRILLLFLSAIFTFTLFLLGYMISPRAAKISTETSTDNKTRKNHSKKCLFHRKEKNNPKKSHIFLKLISLLLIIISVLFYSVYLYTVLLQQYKNTTNFEMIDEKYVVLYKDTENFVVKQCLIDDNTIYIDNDAYQLIDTKDKKIQTIRFKKTGEESVFKRLSSEEFQNLINESNSDEDTPS